MRAGVLLSLRCQPQRCGNSAGPRFGRAACALTTWVFPHLEGYHQGERRMSYIKQWRAACTAAGLPGRIVHDLRQSAVRNMERDGVPRSVATRITGHRTESIYRRYAIVSDADLEAAAARRAQFRDNLAPATVVAIR
jgi:integrase